MTVIAGLTHVPNVYVYASAALKSLGSDVEEAARVAGARPSRRAVREPAAHGRRCSSRGARVLPRLRAFRAAAGDGRSRGQPRALDLSLQAHQQAGHAVLSPHGGRGHVHRGDHLSACPAATLPAARGAQVRDDQGQGRPHEGASPRALGVGCGGAARDLRLRDRDRARVRHRASRVRHQLGIRRGPLGGAHAGQLPLRLRRADAYARDLEHGAHRHGGRGSHGRLLHGDRLREPSPQRRLVALPRLPGARAARGAGVARGSRVPVGVPLLPAAHAAAHRRSSASGSPARSCGSPTGCVSSPRLSCR